MIFDPERVQCEPTEKKTKNTHTEWERQKTWKIETEKQQRIFHKEVKSTLDFIRWISILHIVGYLVPYTEWPLLAWSWGWKDTFAYETIEWKWKRNQILRNSESTQVCCSVRSALRKSLCQLPNRTHYYAGYSHRGLLCSFSFHRIVSFSSMAHSSLLQVWPLLEMA